MKVGVEWRGENRLVVRARQHSLVFERAWDGSDEPSMRPGELMLAALGSCMIGTMMNHEVIKTWPLRRVHVEITGEKTGPPSRYSDIWVRLHLEGDLSEGQIATIKRVATACTIHNTLRDSVAIHVEMVTCGKGGTSHADLD